MKEECRYASWAHHPPEPTEQAFEKANGDKACTQSTVIAAMDKKEEDHHAITAHIAQLEDRVEREESAVCQYSQRPDLWKYLSLPKERAATTPVEDNKTELE
jgi:hypothetical protein